MEQLNSVRLRGALGPVRVIEVGGGRMTVQAQIACSRIFRTENGGVDIETDWIPVRLRSREDNGKFSVTALRFLSRDACLEVAGRVRTVSCKIDEEGTRWDYGFFVEVSDYSVLDPDGDGPLEIPVDRSR